MYIGWLPFLEHISGSSTRPGVGRLKCCQWHMATAAPQPRNWFRKSILVILRSVNSARENEVQAAATSSTLHIQPNKKIMIMRCVYLCVPCLFSLFAFRNNCCWLCGCIRGRALMILTGREEILRYRGQEESNSFSRNEHVWACVCICAWMCLFCKLFLVLAHFVVQCTLFAAYNNCSSSMCRDVHMSVSVSDKCVCVFVCVSTLPVCPFAWIRWWTLQDGDQTSSTPGLPCDHTGIMGDIEL